MFRSPSHSTLLASTTMVVLATAGYAQADDAAEYERGRKLYEAGEHARVEAHFASVIDAPTPRLRDPSLVARGRMLRGASLMYLGRKPDADAQFERILKAEPKFEPDPIIFSAGVLEEFRRVREKVQSGDETVRKIAALTRERDQLRAENLHLRTQVAGLRVMASEERVITRKSRLLASLPFGVGQFQNGESSLGALLLVTESITLVAATVSFAYHTNNISPLYPDRERAESAATTSRVINWVTFGSFVALAVSGVVQAHLAFVPESAHVRVRPLPKALALAPIVQGDGSTWSLGLGGTF